VIKLLCSQTLAHSLLTELARGAQAAWFEGELPLFQGQLNNAIYLMQENKLVPAQQTERILQTESPHFAVDRGRHELN